MESTMQIASVAGYLALAEPLADFLPGTLVGVAPGASEAIVIGNLGGAVSASTPAPTPVTVPAASIDGLAGHSFSASIQGDLLNSILKQIGLGPAASASVSSGDLVQFSFTQVSSVMIAPEAFGTWLDVAAPIANPVLVPYWQPQPGYALFLVTEVLQSQSVSITNPQAANSLAVSAGEGPATVSVGASFTNQEGATYQGSTPVTFAFKAISLSYNTAWQFGGPPAAQYVSLIEMGGKGQSVLGRLAGKIESALH